MILTHEYIPKITYNSLLDCCVRCFDMNTASKIFDEMSQGGCIKSNSRQQEDSSYSVQPDLISYSTMIKGFCKEKNIE